MKFGIDKGAIVGIAVLLYTKAISSLQAGEYLSGVLFGVGGVIASGIAFYLNEMQMEAKYKLKLRKE